MVLSVLVLILYLSAPLILLFPQSNAPFLFPPLILRGGRGSYEGGCPLKADPPQAERGVTSLPPLFSPGSDPERASSFCFPFRE